MDNEGFVGSIEDYERDYDEARSKSNTDVFYRGRRINLDGKIGVISEYSPEKEQGEEYIHIEEYTPGHRIMQTKDHFKGTGIEGSNLGVAKMPDGDILINGNATARRLDLIDSPIKCLRGLVKIEESQYYFTAKYDSKYTTQLELDTIFLEAVSKIRTKHNGRQKDQ